MPLFALEPLAQLDEVQSIRAADEAVTPGPVPDVPSDAGTSLPDAFFDTAKVDASEGDVAHQADLARGRYEVDGSGIGIGVLSNGVFGLAHRQSTGDLPDRVTVLPGPVGGYAEGTAMLEIVHDLAPGADLYFATGAGGQAQLAANIEALCEAGADVIVDDIFYLNEAVFQDGTVAQGINTAVENGCFYVTSAGNSGNLNDGTSGVWEGDFVAGSPFRVNGKSVGFRHDFGDGAVANQIARDSPRWFVLQWADPLGASSNDYDLFLVDVDGDVIAGSTSTQDGTQDPIEYIDSTHTSHEGEYLVVVKAAGEDRYLWLSAHRGELEIATAGATFGHMAASNSVTVAAVDVRTAGSDGVFDGTESVRSYSSDGPRRIFFRPDGTPITPGDFSATGGEVLRKPNLAAADGVSTATEGFSPFHGTSAAAPHVAAMVALILEAAGGPGNVTHADLRAAMAASALDIEDAGFDRDSGAGIMTAPTAVGAFAVPVADRNRPLEAVGGLSDLKLRVDAPSVTVDVSSVFSDPDDDPLSYTVRTSPESPVAVTLSGSRF